MTPERLLILISERLISDTASELSHYEGMLRAQAAPKMTGLRPMERLAIERQITANVEAHAIELALARLRQAPVAPNPKPENRLSRLVSRPVVYND